MLVVSQHANANFGYLPHYLLWALTIWDFFAPFKYSEQQLAQFSIA